ncbi:hypothetical protein C3432_07810 [Citrobacter amalonaticus]|uniref:Uncharacterized protein n=1 Tax=Citrobacter amalonaticus TaxID=35703 RepID=A0A2S4RY51_CITAM|nr:hypothetical protein [Citrobacter amalonaticus]POT57839.1 hypothetical protein C3432_07810 [Citrobacter amalonaticus]POT76634.1 hypothetical protein C3436_04015 [Citrobacter amalonaticus]POU65713.1 hypothetical protein C3430_10430 [Citrobacter amalonaticus]POV05870.1 hypothetical protein C3424_11315 [Citrobacter amalonaticus]
MGKLIAVLISLLLLGCSSQSSLDNREREFILTKVNNYKGLIAFYREQLSKNDTPEVRLKLCEVYNKIEDYESSQNCLKELVNTSPTAESLLLSAQNNSTLGHNDIALKQIDEALKMDPKLGEAFNLKGVILAHLGDLDNAKENFEKARNLFVAEEIVNNNLAMIAIVEKDYNLARSYLMPLYSRGYNSPKIVHNLIFTLVKLNDYSTAETLIRQNNLEDSSQQLIADLDSVTTTVPERAILRTTAPVAVAIEGSDETRKTNPAGLVGASPEMATPVKEVNNTVLKDSEMTSDNQGQVENIVIGEHGKFVRLVFISSSYIKGEKISGGRDNHVEFVLKNFKKNSKINDLTKNVKKYTKSLNNVSIEERGDDLYLSFSAKRIVKQVKAYTSPKSSISSNRLVLDIFF